jgi:hypothetical protein
MFNKSGNKKAINSYCRHKLKIYEVKKITHLTHSAATPILFSSILTLHRWPQFNPKNHVKMDYIEFLDIDFDPGAPQNTPGLGGGQRACPLLRDKRMDWGLVSFLSYAYTILFITFGDKKFLTKLKFIMLLFLVLDYRHGFDALPVSRIKAL